MDIIEELNAIKTVYSSKDRGEYRLMHSEIKALDEAMDSVDKLNNLKQELAKFPDHHCFAVGDIKKMLGVADEVSD